MITAEHKTELAPAIELMNRVLRTETTVEDEFPLVFRHGFSGQVVSFGDEEVVRSACAILRREAVCPQARFTVGLIGSVSTDEAHRRGGLATQVLLAAERALAEQGAVVTLLWADDPRFYYARGYRPVGHELDFVIDADVAAGLPSPDGLRPATPGDAAAIHALYLEHTARLDRTEEETAVLLDCPGMTTLVQEADGKIIGYACLGRGEDLGGTIHEWGGRTESVLGLVRAHHDARPDGEPVFLLAPPTATELAERLTRLGAPPTDGLLGLAKLVNREKAALLLDRLFGDAATVTFDPRAPEAEQVEFTAPTGTVHLNDDTLLVLLFSGKGERAETEDFGDHFDLDVGHLPLDAFVWGLDSI